MNTTRDESVKTAIEIAIKLGALAIVLVVSFLIVKPFIAIVIWSIILAVALSADPKTCFKTANEKDTSFNDTEHCSDSCFGNACIYAFR